MKAFVPGEPRFDGEERLDTGAPTEVEHSDEPPLQGSVAGYGYGTQPQEDCRGN